MNFLEAVKAMKEGKKVRRKDWDNFIVYGAGFFYLNGGGADKRVAMALANFEATDWEIAEEKKTLSDKLYSYDELTEWISFSDEDMAKDRKAKVCLKSDDVKQANKEFIALLLRHFKDFDVIPELAKEIYGERLV